MTDYDRYRQLLGGDWTPPNQFCNMLDLEKAVKSQVGFQQIYCGTWEPLDNQKQDKLSRVRELTNNSNLKQRFPNDYK